MKAMLFAVLEDVHATEEMLKGLAKEGFNGTVAGASSVHRAFAGGGASLSLSDFAEGVKEPNLTVFFIVDEERLPLLQRRIREATGAFKEIHGAMMVIPLASYEGSF